MNRERLQDTALHVADFESVDWAQVLDSASPEDRDILHELEAVAQVAAVHRKLHDLLPPRSTSEGGDRPAAARWGSLELLEEVGRGSYGVVYRAIDTQLRREVALKLFGSEANAPSVIDEGRRLAKVRHENVVTVFGADVHDDRPGIWMEFVRGKTLDVRLKEDGVLGAQEAGHIGGSVCRALAAMHNAGLVHRDVKPQNVMREAGGRIVLMDLGASDAISAADAAGGQSGTPLYMAPEVLAGAPAGPHSDVYSLGVTLFHLVTGRFPYEATSVEQLRSAHAAGAAVTLIDIRPDLPAPFVRAVSKAVDPDPKRRHAGAGAFEAALVELSTRQDERRSQPRSLWWLAVAAAIIGAIVAGVFGSLTNDTPAVDGPQAAAVAVLPFRNLTGDAAKQYVADGFTEALIAELARVPGLVVATSAGSVSTTDASGGDRAVAQQLGVRLLLSGAFVLVGDRVDLTIRLVDAVENRVLLGREIVRPAGALLSVRSEIADLLAAHFSLRRGGESSAPSRAPVSAEAQDAFIKALVAFSSSSVQRRGEAITLLERTVSLEPDWAEAVGLLAYVQQVALESGDPASRQARAEIARANASQAIALDFTQPLGHIALAAIQAYNDWNFPAAEASLRQAVASAPGNPVAWSRLALLLAAKERLPEAIEAAERARDLEPLVPERHTTLGIIRYYARDFDGALHEMERALALSPGYGPGHFGRGRVLAAVGRLDEAIAEVTTAIDAAPGPGYVAFLALLHATAGRQPELDSVLARLKAMEAGGSFASIDNYAYLAIQQGRVDEAFDLLTEAVRRRMTNVLWLAVDPRVDAVRADPRFAAVVSSLGLGVQ